MYKFFEQYDNVVAVMSDVDDGDMRILGRKDDDKNITNRKKFCSKIGIDYKNVVSARLSHSNNVKIIDKNYNQYYKNTDALITKEKNIFLSVTTADCFPILIYEPEAEIVAIIHAGWRGVVNNIISNTLEAMQKFSIDLNKIKIEVGPGISQKNFEFDYEEALKQFRQYDNHITSKDINNKVKINLKKIIYNQIMDYGINGGNINISNICTFDNKNFFSARRCGDESFDAMIIIIGMK